MRLKSAGEKVAPYDPDYLWTNTSATYSMTDTWQTELNEYHGGVYQQVCRSGQFVPAPANTECSPALRSL